MSRLLHAQDPGFAAAWRGLIAARGETLDAAEASARTIVAGVRARGLEAVLEATARFDGLRLTPDGLAVGRDALERAYRACPQDLIDALELAALRLRAFHERAKPSDDRWVDPDGVSMGWRWTPVGAAGLYAPGGLAAYPSAVLMNAIPAKAAGVGRLVMATPPARLHENPAILAAAFIAGVDEVWSIGGAQAIAALAYGAGPIRPVDVIAGPGNAFVAAAKKIVFGDVGIDSIAGPSEVFIVADATAPADWIAADLLAQAEHDLDAQSILFTDDPTLAQGVLEAVPRHIAAGRAGTCAAESWARHGAVVVVRALEEACPLIDEAAPEHLQLAVADPELLLERVRHAGAIFLGVHAPEALGDYLAGPNHVLPTGRRARFSSGLSTLNFMKRTTLIGAGPLALCRLGPAAARIADAEELPAHAFSIRVRSTP